MLSKLYPKVTRTKEQALKLAERVRANIVKGDDFVKFMIASGKGKYFNRSCLHAYHSQSFRHA